MENQYDFDWLYLEEKSQGKLEEYSTVINNLDNSSFGDPFNSDQYLFPQQNNQIPFDYDQHQFSQLNHQIPVVKTGMENQYDFDWLYLEEKSQGKLEEYSTVINNLDNSSFGDPFNSDQYLFPQQNNQIPFDYDQHQFSQLNHQIPVVKRGMENQYDFDWLYLEEKSQGKLEEYSTVINNLDNSSFGDPFNSDQYLFPQQNNQIPFDYDQHQFSQLNHQIPVVKTGMENQYDFDWLYLEEKSQGKLEEYSTVINNLDNSSFGDPFNSDQYLFPQQNNQIPFDYDQHQFSQLNHQIPVDYDQYKFLQQNNQNQYQFSQQDNFIPQLEYTDFENIGTGDLSSLWDNNFSSISQDLIFDTKQELLMDTENLGYFTDEGTSMIDPKNFMISNTNGNQIRQNKRSRMPPLELHEIQKYFNVPMNEAAKELKVGLTGLKKRCRKLNIMRWPHRKIKSMTGLIDNVKEMGLTNEVKMLEENKKMMEKVPNLEMTQKIKKLRKACLKSNYKKRRLLAD